MSTDRGQHIPHTQVFQDGSDPRAKVLVITDSLLAGGAEKVAVDLATTIDRTRFNPHVLVTRSGGPLEQTLAERGINWTIIERDSRIDLQAFQAIRSVMKRANIIHSHKFATNVLVSGLSMLVKAPIIAHEHNWSADISPIQRRAYRLVSRRADRIIACSLSVYRRLELMGIPPSSLRMIPNAVAEPMLYTREDARTALGIPADAYTVGIIARLRPEKGHEVLLSAWHALMQQAAAAHAAQNLRLCIVGDGPQRSQLQQQISQLGLSSSVLLTGEVPDASRYMRAFDTTVISSHWEGLPLSALESMIAGVPLLATAVGELPELLAGGRGVVVPTNNPASMARLLWQLFADPEARRTYAGAARSYVRERYLLSTVAQHVGVQYDRVLVQNNIRTGTLQPGTSESDGSEAA